MRSKERDRFPFRKHVVISCSNIANNLLGEAPAGHGCGMYTAYGLLVTRLTKGSKKKKKREEEKKRSEAKQRESNTFPGEEKKKPSSNCPLLNI